MPLSVIFSVTAARGRKRAQNSRASIRQMQDTVYSLLFLASAPIALMPAAIALFTKSHRAVPIVSFNVLLWGGMYLLLRGSAFGGSLPSPGLIVLLIVWLVLLRFAILPRPETGE
jgi:hypothetical protein